MIAKTGFDPAATSALPDEVEPLSMTRQREKLFKIGAKVIRQDRQVTFQLAEVAIPRRLFAEIRRLGTCRTALFSHRIAP